MKKLAQKIIEEKQIKASSMIGQKLEVQISSKAITIDEKLKQVTFVMSTSNVDRHGDIVDQESWMLDHFNKNPAFFLQHRADQFPIGKWIKVWLEADPDNVGKLRLVGTAEFRVKYEDAARAFDHVLEGDLNMVSVGFIPHRVDYDEEKDAFVLLDCELLECSLVGIGSNRQALAKEIEVESVRDTLIDTKNILDEVIKADNNVRVSAHLNARSLLHKAIRQLK